MSIIDRRVPKPRKPREDTPAPQPYQVHRPDVAAIDAQPRAGDPRPVDHPGYVGRDPITGAKRRAPF